MDKMNLKALAKINLGLDVLGRQEDGYHQVKMIMQTIHLYDEVELQIKDEPGVVMETNVRFLPVNENNLMVKAANLLMEEFSIEKGLYIYLKKFIPVAAGLAGGSSDAAAVLFGLNQMFHLGLSMKELMERGVKIGADVPYCLMRGTALAEGIGEKLTPLPSFMKYPILIAKPGISVSTKFVYQNLKLDDQLQHPDIDKLIEGIKEKDIHKIADNMGNVLESVTIPEYPVIQSIKEEMNQAGAIKSMMSGSGPTVFGIFENEKDAKNAYYKVKKSGLADRIYLTTIFNVNNG